MLVADIFLQLSKMEIIFGMYGNLEIHTGRGDKMRDLSYKGLQWVESHCLHCTV